MSQKRWDVFLDAGMRVEVFTGVGEMQGHLLVVGQRLTPAKHCIMNYGADMKKNLIYTLKMLWNADKFLVTWEFFTWVLSGTMGAFLSVYMTKYILTCIERQRPFAELVFYVGMICILHICLHILSAVQRYVRRRKGPAVYRHVFSQIIDASLRMEYAKFEQPEFFDKYARALDSAASKSLEIMENLFNFLGVGTGIAIAADLVVRTDPRLLLFIILPAALNIALRLKTNKLYYNMDKESTRDNRVVGYTKRVFYEKKYASEIRLSAIRNVLLSYHKKAVESKHRIIKKHRIKIATLEALINVAFGLMCTMAPFIYIAYTVSMTPDIEIGSFIAAAIAALGYVTGNIGWFVMLATNVDRDCRLMQNIRDFIEYEPAAEQTKRIATPDDIADIEINNLEFTYSGAVRPALKGLSLSVRRGERVALVGPNGAGKTTLIKLIMGLYAPTGGVIKVGRHDIRDYDQKEYRSHIGAVFQDLQIFALSVAENVLMRKPECQADRDAVFDALDKAQLNDVALPNGVDTVISREYDENGLVLSGGQAQKIALARVFAKNPDIVILDEPSSALDPISEFNMYQNMMRLSENKAVILISHRLSSARIADKIYMLEDGRIIEQGSHVELMRQDGKYARMFLLQAQNYQESLPDDMEVMLDGKTG